MSPSAPLRHPTPPARRGRPSSSPRRVKRPNYANDMQPRGGRCVRRPADSRGAVRGGVTPERARGQFVSGSDGERAAPPDTSTIYRRRHQHTDSQIVTGRQDSASGETAFLAAGVRRRLRDGCVTQDNARGDRRDTPAQGCGRLDGHDRPETGPSRTETGFRRARDGLQAVPRVSRARRRPSGPSERLPSGPCYSTAIVSQRGHRAAEDGSRVTGVTPSPTSLRHRRR